MKTQQPKPRSRRLDAERTTCIRAARQGPARIRAIDADNERRLLKRLSKIGFDLVHEAIPLLTFGRRMLARLQPEAEVLPLPYFADALKRVIGEMHHEQLHVLSPSESIGVGYVYDVRDPDTWPVRWSC